MGDSFYIRTEFSRSSINKSLEFKKGDILYIDNTLFNGRPGYWRAWQVDQFGHKMDCGIIPSKYNAQCEMLTRSRSQSHSKWTYRLRLFAMPYRIFFWRSKPRYTKLGERKKEEKSRVLASYSVPYLENALEDVETKITGTDNEKASQVNKPKSYQIVNMYNPKKPRPVFVFGPFSHLIVEQLEKEFPDLYKQYIIQNGVMDYSQDWLYRNRTKQYSSQKSQLEYIVDIINNNGVHPVISVASNTVEHFKKNGLFPIVIGLKFRSAKHIKETVNKWKINDRRIVYYKMAKASYNHMLRLEQEFQDSVHVYITGNNLTYMCTQIADRVRVEQNKVIWSDISLEQF